MADGTTCRVTFKDGARCERKRYGQMDICKPCYLWSYRRGGEDPEGRQNGQSKGTPPPCPVVYSDGTPCGRPRHSHTNQYCTVCDLWKRRNGGANPNGRDRRNVHPTEGACRVSDCTHEGALIDGYCRACYHWARNHPGEDHEGRKRLQFAPEDGQCTVINPNGAKCTNDYYGTGMCNTHWQRVRDNEDPHMRKLRSHGEVMDALLNAAFAETDECIIAPDGDHRRPVSVDGEKMMTARAVYYLGTGRHPDVLHVLHACNGGSGAHGCINIRHLRLGTHDENMQDKQEAERQARGETHGMHRLAEDNVRDIRRRYYAGNRAGAGNCADLAAEFGVTKGYIREIAGRRTWAWLPD